MKKIKCCCGCEFGNFIEVQVHVKTHHQLYDVGLGRVYSILLLAHMVNYLYYTWLVKPIVVYPN